MTLYSIKKYKKKKLYSKHKKHIGGYPIVTDDHYSLFFYITVSAYNAIDQNGNIDENSEITNIDEINRVFYADDEKWEVNSYYLKDDKKNTLGLIDQFTDLINNEIKDDFEDLSGLKIDFINEIFFDLPGLIKVKSFVKDNNPEDDLENINDAFNQISEKNLWQYLFTNDLNYVKYNNVYYKLTSIMTTDEYQNQFWEEHFDEQSKNYYYYNSFSKKSQWEKPENCPIKDRQ